MFASLKPYIDFARSSDARLPRMVAEIDVTASLIKILVPSLANFLKRSIVTCRHILLKISGMSANRKCFSTNIDLL